MAHEARSRWGGGRVFGLVACPCFGRGGTGGGEEGRSGGLGGAARRHGHGDLCTGGGTATYRSGAVECTAYAPCAARTDVVLCLVVGGGHSWPGGPPFLTSVLGEPNGDLDAGRAIWRFFSDHSLPPGET